MEDFADHFRSLEAFKILSVDEIDASGDDGALYGLSGSSNVVGSRYLDV